MKLIRCPFCNSKAISHYGEEIYYCYRCYKTFKINNNKINI